MAGKKPVKKPEGIDDKMDSLFVPPAASSESAEETSLVQPVIEVRHVSGQQAQQEEIEKIKDKLDRIIKMMEHLYFAQIAKADKCNKEFNRADCIKCRHFMFCSVRTHLEL